MDMRGALQAAGLTRSREAAKVNAGDLSVVSCQSGEPWTGVRGCGS